MTPEPASTNLRPLRTRKGRGFGGVKRLILSLMSLGAIACTEQGSGNAPPTAQCSLIGATQYSNCGPGGNPVFDECCDRSDGSSICWNANVQFPPADCDGSPYDPNPEATTTATSTSGGSATGTTGGTCVDCPEDANGICPDHARWNRGVIVTGLWESDNSGVLSANPATDQHACANSFSQCIQYEEAADVHESHHVDLRARQKGECEEMTLSQVEQLTGSLANWTLVDHFCTFSQGTNITSSYGGGWSGKVPTSTSPDLVSCGSGDYVYDGFCTEDECDYGSGSSSSSGGAADTGSGGIYVDEYDCSMFSNANLDWATVGNPRNGDRTATVRGDATDKMKADIRDALVWCSGAKLDPTTLKLFGLPGDSFLTFLGLAKNDIIVSVNGKTGNTVMIDEIADDLTADPHEDSVVKIKRGTKTYTYTVSWI